MEDIEECLTGREDDDRATDATDESVELSWFDQRVEKNQLVPSQEPTALTLQCESAIAIVKSINVDTPENIAKARKTLLKLRSTIHNVKTGKSHALTDSELLALETEVVPWLRDKIRSAALHQSKARHEKLEKVFHGYDKHINSINKACSAMAALTAKGLVLGSDLGSMLSYMDLDGGDNDATGSSEAAPALADSQPPRPKRPRIQAQEPAPARAGPARGKSSLADEPARGGPVRGKASAPGETSVKAEPACGGPARGDTPAARKKQPASGHNLVIYVTKKQLQEIASGVSFFYRSYTKATVTAAKTAASKQLLVTFRCQRGNREPLETTAAVTEVTVVKVEHLPEKDKKNMPRSATLALKLELADVAAAA